VPMGGGGGGEGEGEGDREEGVTLSVFLCLSVSFDGKEQGRRTPGEGSHVTVAVAGEGPAAQRAVGGA
jgi:hypothetical protein